LRLHQNSSNLPLLTKSSKRPLMTDPSMHWKQFLLITRQLPVWIVTAAVLISAAGSADRQRKAVILRGGRVEFSPNRRAFWAWPLLVVYLVYATVSQLKGSHGRPLDLIIAAGLGILAMMFIFTFPETIVVTDDSLEQISWLWKKKQIRWADIVEINTGEKRRTVTITGQMERRSFTLAICQTRSRLLMELRDHCGEKLPPDFPREPTAAF
jgi:hypothetical protein